MILNQNTVVLYGTIFTDLLTGASIVIPQLSDLEFAGHRQVGGLQPQQRVAKQQQKQEEPTEPQQNRR